MSKITVTVEGANRVELAKQLRAFAANLDGAPASKAGKVQAADDEDETEVDDDDDDENAPVAKKTKAGAKKSKKKPAATDDDSDDADDSDEDDGDDADDSDDDDEADSSDDSDDDDEDDEDGKPAKKKAPAKKAKVTVKDVNAACKKYSKSLGEEGFKKTKILLNKKFGVTSVTDLKPEQYAAVLKLLAV